jgi:putative addiction module component (TIGR02574 family)
MSATPVLRAALKLPPRSRARLAGQLLASIEGQTKKRIDRLWGQEVEARIDAFDAGRMKSVPAAEVLRYRGKPAR